MHSLSRPAVVVRPLAIGCYFAVRSRTARRAFPSFSPSDLILGDLITELADASQLPFVGLIVQRLTASLTHLQPLGCRLQRRSEGYVRPGANYLEAPPLIQYHLDKFILSKKLK